MIYLEIIGGEGLKILIICTTWFVNRLKGFSLKQPAGRKLKRGKIPGQELATSELRSRAMGLAVGCGSRASERRGKLLPWYPSRYRLPTSWFKGFNTVRARLAREGLGTVRARLAWGGLGTVRASLGGSQFYNRNPFKRNFRKAQNFAKKMKGVNLKKEIPLNDFSKNIKILVKLEKNLQKRHVTRNVLKHLTFSMI